MNEERTRHMLYYVKTDRLFNSLEVEVDDRKFYFDASTLEHKRANEKRELVYELTGKRDDGTLVFSPVSCAWTCIPRTSVNDH